MKEKIIFFRENEEEVIYQLGGDYFLVRFSLKDLKRGKGGKEEIVKNALSQGREEARKWGIVPPP